MKITILIDNSTLSSDLVSEHGFCAFIEESNKKILFDTGEEGNLIANADKLGIDLTDLDYIVFSHGHYDHTCGLCYLLEMYKERGLEKYPIIIAHSKAFYSKIRKGENIGSKLSFQEIKNNFEVILTDKPYSITENLLFLGEVPRKNDFEGKYSIGFVNIDGEDKEDFILDDSALVFKGERGLSVASGCSHSGICNILDYAIEICKDNRILNVLGGLHLKNSDEVIINRTIKELIKFNPEKLYACHCTGNLAYELLEENEDIKFIPIGCGFKTQFK